MESVKTKKSCVSWKMFKMDFKFSSIRSKALCLGISEPTNGWLLGIQGNRQGKQAFVEENEKNICVKEICKILEIYE